MWLPCGAPPRCPLDNLGVVALSKGLPRLLGGEQHSDLSQRAKHVRRPERPPKQSPTPFAQPSPSVAELNAESRRQSSAFANDRAGSRCSALWQQVPPAHCAFPQNRPRLSAPPAGHLRWTFSCCETERKRMPEILPSPSHWPVDFANPGRNPLPLKDSCGSPGVGKREMGGGCVLRRPRCRTWQHPHQGWERRLAV